MQKKYTQTAKFGYLIISALLFILGIVIVAYPGFSISVLCWVGGLLLLLFGVVKILGYLSNDLYRLAFQYDLAFGILLISLGAILIFRSDAMVHIVCSLLGLYILADALLKIQISLDAKRFGISQWWIVFTLAIVTSVVGFLLIFQPSKSARMIMCILGLSLCAEGLLNIITILTTVHHG